MTRWNGYLDKALNRFASLTARCADANLASQGGGRTKIPHANSSKKSFPVTRKRNRRR